MKKISIVLLVIYSSICISACKSKEERTLGIHVYAVQPFTQEDDQYANAELVALQEPIACEKSNIAVTPNVVVHRLDITNTPSEAISFPLSKSGEFRKRIDFLSFKHYKGEFEKNGQRTPNSKLLYQPGNQVPNMSDLQIDGSEVWYCCGKEGNRQYRTIEDLMNALQDSLCMPGFDRPQINVLYNQEKIIVDPVDPEKITTSNPSIHTTILAALNELGNADQPTTERIQLVEQYYNLFTTDADIVVLGNSTGKIIDEPIPVKEYMERIAMFKSLESIEIVEVLTNDEEKVWEVRLKEYYK